ncbi:MAG: hypothetical protein JO056_08320 [Alphaproteobacteria bacterium]|nr:hypothetical protein [Alphaproteobacteria bacterium]
MRICSLLLTSALAVALLSSAAHAAVIISTNPTQNMSCSGGVCTPTAKNAVLNVDDLQALLAAGNVKVLSSKLSPDISLNAALSWTNGSRLTLDSYRSLYFRQTMTVAGTGAVTLKTNDGGSGGQLLFFPGGKLDFWDTASNLTIDGNRFVLVKDLRTLSQNIREKPHRNYALAKDCDAKTHGRYRNSPIGVLDSIFEGLGHTIDNVTIEAAPKAYVVALFGRLTVGATARDIQVTNVGITDETSSPHYVAMLAAINEGSIVNASAEGKIVAGTQYGEAVGGLVALNGVEGGLISNSRATSSILIRADSNTEAGGLAGYNYRAIENSYASGAVTGGIVAGLVSSNRSAAGHIGTISHSRASVTIKTNGVTGGRGAGLVGFNAGGVIADSSSSGSVVATDLDDDAGGLVGASDGGATITRSFSTGSVEGAQYAGGLIGKNSGQIVDSYALGPVSGNSSAVIGGLVGSHSGGSVKLSYSIGQVSGGSAGDAGGLIGKSGAQTDQSYWDIDTSGRTQSAGGIGLSDAQLRSGLPDGFDPKIWASDPNVNNGYPYLLANPPPK